MTAFAGSRCSRPQGFLAPLIVSYVKHRAGGELGVSIRGAIHGGLFFLCVILALALRQDAGSSARTTSLILLGAALPFGGCVVDAWLLRWPAHERP
jgi:integral membrane protein